MPKAVVINSDASLEVYGVHATNNVVIGKISPQKCEHINMKELQTILEFFKEADTQNLYPPHTNFEVRGDNTTTMAYVRKGFGSKSPIRISKKHLVNSIQEKMVDFKSRLGGWRSSQKS